MNTTIELYEMRAFVAVVTDGSFTAAAERLSTDKARMSRIVRRIEEKLGAQLLIRSTRHLNVTEVGRNYYERAVSILSAAEAAEVAVAQQYAEPKGLLRITSGSEFGTMVVDAWIAEYLRVQPKVTVDIFYTNRVVDIIHEGIDVAIRVGKLQDSELSARKLGEITYGLYATPDYLIRKPEPVSIDDLKYHDLIMKSTRGRSNWLLANEDNVVNVTYAPRAIVNNIIAAKNLAFAGIGITQLPRFIADEYVANGILTHILPEWAESPQPVHAVFASSRYMDPKVRSFVDFCIHEFNQSNRSAKQAHITR